MLPFSLPSITQTEHQYVLDSLSSNHLVGDGKYTSLISRWLEERMHARHVLLTTSGTSALEMAALLLDLHPGDEIIAPSYTFSSTINAFMLRGAKPVFCDVRTNTMNMDEALIEGLITQRTKAIFTVDYAGVPCEMDTINMIAKKHNLHVVEDAAQAVGSYYHDRSAGALSELGCYSFHNTKNYTMGEGGAIVINDAKYMERAEILREKGTNRSQMLHGLTDKYTWQAIGGSFLPSDILAALLYAQLQRFDEIMDKRMAIWDAYHAALEPLERQGKLRRPIIPLNTAHNAHMYYIILPSAKERTHVMRSLQQKGIGACFHYVPLHSSPFGLSLGYTPEMLPVTEEYAARLLRLPLYTDMEIQDVEFVIEQVYHICREMEN